MPNPFRVYMLFALDPRVVAALQPWAEISQRLRRICFQLKHYLELLSGTLQKIACYAADKGE